jgi:tripartite-type tricarboxylate transporter receptor subunit TctC
MQSGNGSIGRRGLMAGAAAGLALPARAQDAWPNRPVKLIIPFPAGGASDFIARLWGDKLQGFFGQPFVLDNRGGASGSIGVEAVIRSAPDGHTLLQTPNSPITVVPQLRKVNYDARKDLLPIARVGDMVAGFVIVSSLGINTMAELVTYAKKNPGKLSYGSAGLGTATHMRIEMLKTRAGIDILHVPYRGSAEALNDVLAGNIQMMNEIIALPHVRSGKLKLLAVNYPTRHPDYPDVPTLAEAGFPNADVPIWYSLQAPAGTPRDIITRLNAKIVETAQTEDMIRRMREINIVVPVQTPEEIAIYRDADMEANAKLVREANIRLD